MNNKKTLQEQLDEMSPAEIRTAGMRLIQAAQREQRQEYLTSEQLHNQQVAACWVSGLPFQLADKVEGTTQEEMNASASAMLEGLLPHLEPGLVRPPLEKMTTTQISEAKQILNELELKRQSKQMQDTIHRTEGRNDH